MSAPISGAGDLAPPARASLLRTTLLLLPVQVIFRAGEALLPPILVIWFGRSTAIDVYTFLWAAFALAGSLVFSAYQDSALVPILADVRIQDKTALPRVTGSLLAHTLVLSLALSVAIGAFALGSLQLLFRGADLALSLRMIAPFSLYLVALSVKWFFVALLNAEHRFFAFPLASCVGVIANVTVIGCLRHPLGVVSIPVGSLAGELVALAVLLTIALRVVRLRISLNFTRPEPVRRFARLIAAEVGGGAVTRINPVIDQFMAGLTGVLGAGMILRNTGDLSSLPTSLLQASLLPVLLSHLADDVAAGKVARVRATVTRSLLSVCTLLLGAALAIFFVRGPLLRLVFLHGEMDVGGVERMAAILPYHLVGLAPFGALLILARAHVALKNSTIMVSMGILNASLNVVFNVILLRAIGLEGIALSTSCVYLVVAVVFWFRLDTKLAEPRAVT